MKRGFLQNKTLHPTQTDKPVKETLRTSTLGNPLPSSTNAANNKEVALPAPNRVIPCGPVDPLDEGKVIFTTLPSRGKDEPKPPGTVIWSRCFFDRDTYQELMDQPGFPGKLEQPEQKGYYRVGPSSISGMGLFADRSFKQGDVVFSERPLLISPASSAPAVLLLAKTDSKAAASLSQMHQAEIYMTKLVDEMHPDDREAYMGLCNSHLEDGSTPLMGISRTNAFGINSLQFLKNENIDERLKTYSAVCRDLSRLNHSCSPNVVYAFNKLSLSYDVHVLRDIKAGEEIFCTYITPTGSAQERAEELSRWGFRCSCPACKNPAESDTRRAKVLSNLQTRTLPMVQDFVSRQSFSESERADWEKWLEEQIDLIERERMEFMTMNYFLYMTAFRKVTFSKHCPKESDRERVEMLQRKCNAIKRPMLASQCGI